MNESFRVYNHSPILNRALEFPVTVVWTETHILSMTYAIYYQHYKAVRDR